VAAAGTVDNPWGQRHRLSTDLRLQADLDTGIQADSRLDTAPEELAIELVDAMLRSGGIALRDDRLHAAAEPRRFRQKHCTPLWSDAASARTARHRGVHELACSAGLRHRASAL
jgi:hypothetical protein